MNPDDKILLYHNDGSRVLGKSFQYLDKETNLKLQILKLLILQRWYRQYSNTLFFCIQATNMSFRNKNYTNFSYKIRVMMKIIFI